MPFWRIWPADRLGLPLGLPLGLRPHVNRRHLAWGAAAILGGLVLVVILVAATDLVLDFKAFPGWRDVAAHSTVRGRSYSSGGTTRRPEYSITELTVPSD